MTVGSHGSTYGGNPLAMTAGNAVLDLVLKPDFLERVRASPDLCNKTLAMLAAEHPKVIAEVRGRGLLLGLKLHVPLLPSLPACGKTVCSRSAPPENVARLLPPLNIEESHVKEALTALRRPALPFETERKAV
jgi:acetylornithine/N-succinyldiaminopimelate aminotransferase